MTLVLCIIPELLMIWDVEFKNIKKGKYLVLLKSIIVENFYTLKSIPILIKL